MTSSVSDVVMRPSPTFTSIYFSYVQHKWRTEPKRMAVS